MPTSKAASPTLTWGVSKRIKCHIELEEIDPLLAEDADKSLGFNPLWRGPAAKTGVNRTPSNAQASIKIRETSSFWR